jgi:branched-chain amino acid transport system substrate-binding protein
MTLKQVALFALLLAVPAGAQAYDEKSAAPEQPKAEVLPPGATRAPAATLGASTERQYPYYGNTPEEMLPYRNIVPYYEYWTTRLPFRGPGKDYPDPTDLKSLKVGLLTAAKYGPEGARGQRTRRGVLLAFEEENAARKPGQLPFEIVEREDAPQWGSAANIAVDFKDNDVLGILGTIDGDATHVALRVALKMETYIINTSDPDPTLTETQIPWLSRIFPEERQQCFRLADLIIHRRGCKRIAILREGSRPGRAAIMHFVNDTRRLGYPPVAHLLHQPGNHDLTEQIKAIKAAEPDAILLHGQPQDLGYAAAALRKAGINAPFFGFDRLHDESFAQIAGPAAEGATITYFFDPDRQDKPWLDFQERFRKRWGEGADVYAAYGYDGAKLMIEAINKSGPNRFRIRDYLGGLDELDGVTGRIIFDGRWDNIAPVCMAEYKQGKWHFLAAPPLTKLDKATPLPK